MKVEYLQLSDLVSTKNASITTVFKQKGSCWSSGWHNGVDIACAANTPIYAAADGVVVNADTTAHNDGYGNRVVLKHPDGKATLYAHMIAPAPVKVGQAVKKGQLIGKVGNTGLSYGAHLHFSVIDNYDKNPNIYYLGDLLDPVTVCGLGTLKGSGTSAPTTPASGSVKSLDTLASEIWAGKWGNGNDRKKRLTDAGYDAGAVQRRVDRKYYGAKFIPYSVRVDVSTLNLRSAPGTDKPSLGYIKPGTYRIADEENGMGAKLWGKLADGSGWIALDFASRV